MLQILVFLPFIETTSISGFEQLIFLFLQYLRIPFEVKFQISSQIKIDKLVKSH
jgi:hypothetical protein